MIYNDDLKRLRKEMHTRKDDLCTELSNMPAGELYSRQQDGRTYYYQRLKKEGLI